jgi:hypothetical protein
MRFGDLAHVWQPSRLKGIQVSPDFGTPFLAATQVFDLRPTPRKWLALERTQEAAGRFVERGTILVTCSGSVGRATLAFEPHLRTLITHDLLRVEPRDDQFYGWLYAYLRSAQAQAMMIGAQYGHVIKHLECAHLNSLPIPVLHVDGREHFNSASRAVLEKRDKAYSLVAEAEELFTASVGKVDGSSEWETGFEVPTTKLFSGRRRLEGNFDSPRVIAILKQFKRRRLKTQELSQVTERIWLMARIKRVFGETGLPYLSADELFSINPGVSKRVLIEQTGNAGDFYVKAGWIVMARSGQTYGLIGSVALMTESHERAFLSDDLIRIVPRSEQIHPGYLYAALGHPKFGRPLLLHYSYGTSIPHLEPSDVATFPVVRLSEAVEREIGEKALEAAALRAEADEIENAIAANAQAIIHRFTAGDSNDISQEITTIR